MEKKIILLLFAIFSIYYILFFYTIAASWQMVFKLIPMLLLIFLALRSKGEKKYKTIIIGGLIFCAIGDYTLQWFIIGLFSFLIGHIFYIIAFQQTNEGEIHRLVKMLLIAYGGFMMVFLLSFILPDGGYILALAVCAYIGAILLMGWNSFRTASSFAIIGALLFISSDSILAINRFITDIPYSHILIMLTYYAAQLFIALSIVQYSALRSKMIQ
ncbi:lysoplasmalogenase [Metasolibacillus sp.]|uniref:lysoplasmalogenase n=1 Tax=Metasolibacillus sp. TaxID=2703680 RepID=UPI0025F08A03|nr:lysoplasmalogenase [Metasolibacillus sp.]MCT6925204.1 lysoplasmalogenase [Metasolibacillus sp.]MCT6941438.1 lysoplasmalogenase [Metasolibacillus sp.]